MQAPPSAGERSTQVEILLCDDSRDLRRLLGSFLDRDPRLRVVGEAGDVERAAEMAAELQPDVILLELALGERLDGLSAIPHLRDRAPHMNVLVLSSLSASGGMEDMARGFGASGYLEKGTPLADIQRAIHELASRQL